MTDATIPASCKAGTLLPFSIAGAVWLATLAAKGLGRGACQWLKQMSAWAADYSTRQAFPL